jgi:hypothetical protein
MASAPRLPAWEAGKPHPITRVPLTIFRVLLERHKAPGRSEPVSAVRNLENPAITVTSKHQSETELSTHKTCNYTALPNTFHGVY